MEWGPGGKASSRQGPGGGLGGWGHGGAEGLGRAEGLRAWAGGLEPWALRFGGWGAVQSGTSHPGYPPGCQVDAPQWALAQLAVVGSIRDHT